MDREVFTDPAVAGVCNQSLLYFRVDAEKGEGPAVAKKFGVRGFPTFVFLDGDGKELDRQVGASDKAEFLALLKDVAAGDHLVGLRAKAEKAPADAALQGRLGVKLARNGDAAATAHLKKAVELDPKNAHPSTVQARFHLALAEAGAGRTPVPIADFAKEFPDSPAALDAHRILASIYGQMGDEDLQAVSLEILVKRAPDANNRNALAWYLSTRGRELERALALVDEALKETPDDSAPLDTRAECLSRLGRHDEAVAVQEKAVKCLPEDTDFEVRLQYEERLTDFRKKRDAAKAGGTPKAPDAK